ncbi:hypothetical protein [Bacillus haynesii]|uniref:hypothetical protein n=1 Tax=Bacillus haynesii TaxID=1925021 RepID=UPI00227FACDC|nr:hypothetical protein [Bacillus haynesii]MCY7990741.1 hypothetical protein [Bacillus haynesii]
MSNLEWCESSYYINSLYMLSREFFKIGETEAALFYYKKGQFLPQRFMTLGLWSII